MRDEDQISVAAGPNPATVSKRIGRFATGQSKRIGFLFNHDQIHQIAHSLPIALALAALGGPFEVVIGKRGLETADQAAAAIGC